MWSVVDSKKNQVYIWLAIDRNSREIVGCFIGDRTRKSARQLWASLPDVYQQSAVVYTDFWQAYKTVIPPERHQTVGKETGQTSHIERLNNTFRQRVSRLVRASLSFSKKLNNHIGAIWYFIHGYNAELTKTCSSPLLPYHYRSLHLFATGNSIISYFLLPCQPLSAIHPTLKTLYLKVFVFQCGASCR